MKYFSALLVVLGCLLLVTTATAQTTDTEDLSTIFQNMKLSDLINEEQLSKINGAVSGVTGGSASSSGAQARNSDGGIQLPKVIELNINLKVVLLKLKDGWRYVN